MDPFLRCSLSNSLLGTTLNEWRPHLAKIRSVSSMRVPAGPYLHPNCPASTL